MKFLVIGRTAAGKDTLVDTLEGRYGWKRVLSATTRPPRFDSENTHRFVTMEEAKVEANKMAITEIGPDLYYATRRDIEKGDIYVVDPVGAREIVENMPEEHFAIIYVHSAEKDRRSAFVSRAMKNHDTLCADAEALFDRREADERERFALFEQSLADDPFASFAENMLTITHVENDYSSDVFSKAADGIRFLKESFKAFGPERVVESPRPEWLRCLAGIR